MVKGGITVKIGLSSELLRKQIRDIPIIQGYIDEDDNITIIKLWNGEEICIETVVSDSGYPKQIKEIIASVHSDFYCVILAPYISEQTADICKESGFGFLDMSGNCYIAHKSLFIEIKGNKNIYKPKRSIKSVYERSSIVSSMILRILLEDVNRFWKLKDLAKAAGCSIGQVSKVKDFLLQQTYIEQTKEGIRVIDPKALMKDWSAVYYNRNEEKVQCYSLDGLPDIEDRIAKMREDVGISCLLTGFSGGVRYQPVVRYQKVHILIDYKDLDNAIEYLNLKRVDTGANVIFIIQYDECVRLNSKLIKNNEVASPVQIYLDCMGIKGRGEEIAEAVLDREICK